jgi:hypothetical protein
MYKYIHMYIEESNILAVSPLDITSHCSLPSRNATGVHLATSLFISKAAAHSYNNSSHNVHKQTAQRQAKCFLSCLTTDVGRTAWLCLSAHELSWTNRVEDRHKTRRAVWGCRVVSHRRSGDKASNSRPLHAHSRTGGYQMSWLQHGKPGTNKT